MKLYPTETISVLDWDTLEPTSVIYAPTKEAIRNFESYLDDDEKEFYENLLDIDRLQIVLSCDPFRSLLSKMGKI